MQLTLKKHKEFWAKKDLSFSSFLALVFFIVSLVINYGAISLSYRDASNSVTDILLNNLPVINTDIIFSEGAAVFVLFVVFLFIANPKIIPFTLKSVSLFICVRSCFVVMTHLAPPVGHIFTHIENSGYISLGSDLFFSGHTGLPFLMSLLFWDNKNLRYLFLGASVIAGTAVILGHLHYTIDVFSAYFITHGIYLIAQKLFKVDFELLKTTSFLNKSFDLNQ